MISFVPALATVSARCLRSAAALCGGPSSGRIPLTPVDGGHKRKCSGKSASGANEVKVSSRPHVSPSCGKGEQFAPSHEQLRNRLAELMDKLDLARLLLIVNPGGWPTVPWKAWSASRATSTWLASGLRALKRL